VAAPAVTVSGLVKRYGSRTVIDHVDLHVARGELLALLGPNGAGKTTLVEIVEGYRKADAGTVQVLGSNPWGAGPSHRARVGIMLQDGGVDPRARPLEVLRLYASLFAAPLDPGDVLNTVGLQGAAATRYRQLSGGEKQRLALGLAIVGRPELLMLDEPTAGMDPAARAATRTLISGLRQTGVSILLTTHDLGDVERLADRVAILDRGRIVALGPPGEVAGGREPEVRVRVAGGLNEGDLGRLQSAIAARLPGTIARLQGPEMEGRVCLVPPAISPETVTAIAAACADAGLLIAELRPGSASLEDRYLELTGDRAVAGGAGEVAG
jgi:ABC-2 type transport system ATP-binding protein